MLTTFGLYRRGRLRREKERRFFAMRDRHCRRHCRCAKPAHMGADLLTRNANLRTFSKFRKVLKFASPEKWYNRRRKLGENHDEEESCKNALPELRIRKTAGGISPLYTPNRNLVYYRPNKRKSLSAYATQRVLHWLLAGGKKKYQTVGQESER